MTTYLVVQQNILWLQIPEKTQIILLEQDS